MLCPFQNSNFTLLTALFCIFVTAILVQMGYKCGLLVAFGSFSRLIGPVFHISLRNEVLLIPVHVQNLNFIHLTASFVVCNGYFGANGVQMKAFGCFSRLVGHASGVVAYIYLAHTCL